MTKTFVHLGEAQLLVHYTPLGLKARTVMLHATTTTKVIIDHTKRTVLTHMPPSPSKAKYSIYLLGIGHCMPPTPQIPLPLIKLSTGGLLAPARNVLAY